MLAWCPFIISTLGGIGASALYLDQWQAWQALPDRRLLMTLQEAGFNPENGNLDIWSKKIIYYRRWCSTKLLGGLWEWLLGWAPEASTGTVEFKATLPRLLTQVHTLLPIPQLPRDTRKLKSALLKTRPVSWTLLTSHSSQWDKKTVTASLPQFKSCLCK